MEFISIKTALADYFRNTGRKDEINEGSILQWASDAMEKVGSFRQYVSNIALLDLTSYKAKLPNDFLLVELLVYNSDTSQNCNELSLELSETISPTLEDNCSVIVSRSCESCCGQAIVETVASDELVKSHPWIGYSNVVLTSDSYNKKYGNSFTPMHLNDKAALNMHLSTCKNVDMPANGLDYTIRDGYIISNMKTGRLLLFYLGQRTDEEGYPMIPNRIEYIEAIYYYIEMRMAWIDYTADKGQNSRMLFRDTQQLSNDAIARCVTAMNTPTWEEAIEISEMWRQRIPQVNLRGSNADYYKVRNKLITNAGASSTSPYNRFR